MRVSDFQWDSATTGDPPTKPCIVQPHIQKSPPTGAFSVMVVAAITEAVGTAPYRHFTCAVEVEAVENRADWQKAMDALLVKVCLERWER